MQVSILIFILFSTIFLFQRFFNNFRSTTGAAGHAEIPDHGLVRDGTPCGDNLVCVNQTCTSIYPYVDQSKCPSNHNNHECSGHGVFDSFEGLEIVFQILFHYYFTFQACSNVNRCHCYPGWAGPDCSIEQEITTPIPTTWIPVTEDPKKGKNDLDMKMEKKETRYGS